MKILCVGEALIDMICVDKGKSLSEGNNFLKKTGGAPTNVAAAIASLGGQARRQSLLAARRIAANFRYVAAVNELRGRRVAVRRLKTCAGPLPGIYRSRA